MLSMLVAKWRVPFKTLRAAKGFKMVEVPLSETENRIEDNRRRMALVGVGVYQ